MECDFYLLLFFLDCLLLIPSMCFMFLCTDYISITPKTKTEKEKKKRRTKQQQRPSPNAVQIHHRIQQPRIENCNSTEKYDFDDVDADDDTQCARWQSGNGSVRRSSNMRGPKGTAVAAAAIPRSLFNRFQWHSRPNTKSFQFWCFPSVHWIRIRCTGTRGQHKSDVVEKRCEKRTRLGSSVRTNRMYYYFYFWKKNWVNDCMRQWRLVDG